MIINLKKDSLIKQVVSGFSWTTLFFGWWVPLIRGDIKYFAIMLVISILTFGVAHLVFAFIYNNIYIRNLIENNWEPFDEFDKEAIKLVCI